MSDIEYVVMSGDTLSGIAWRHDVTVEALSLLNGLSDVNRIWLGQAQKIPRARPLPSRTPSRPAIHRVRAGETLSELALRYDLTVEALVEANDLGDANQIWVGQALKLPKRATEEKLHAAAKPIAPSPKPPAAPTPPPAPVTPPSTRKPPTPSGGHSAPGSAPTVAGEVIDGYVIHSREVRAKGSLAWRNNNPGNIRNGAFADAHGAFKGKKNHGFAIFPDHDTGFAALTALLKTDAYKRLTLTTAMQKYAPASDNNDPAAYARSVSKMTGLVVTRTLATLSEEELHKFAGAIQRVEGWNPGDVYGWNDERLPASVRKQLAHAAVSPAVSGSPRVGASAPTPYMFGTPLFDFSNLENRTLGASVGQGGKNASADVELVQRLLNAHRPVPLMPLPVTGVADSRLVAGILDFQRSAGLSSPDGRVDPGGRTFELLSAFGAAHPGGAGGAPPVSLANAHQATLKKLGEKARKRLRLPNKGLCAQGVCELLGEVGYRYEGARPFVSSGIINGKVYDYGTRQWVASSTQGSYVSNHQCIDTASGKLKKGYEGSVKTVGADASAKFMGHTLKLLKFAQCTEFLPGNGRRGTPPQESVRALRALPEGAVVVFGPALSRSMQKVDGKYAVGGHGHAGHVGVLVHEGKDVWVIADGLTDAVGQKYTVELCLGNYAWAVGFVPTAEPMKLTAKDRPSNPL
jgi:LysM repeat protein/peptidoglycan hydrolase-like protein with peptidoglycan-binding domain